MSGLSEEEEERNRRTGLGRILKNSFSSQALQGSEILLFLVLTPFTVHQLGVEQYGVWGILWAAVSLFALVDLGFGRAVVKFVADTRGRNDDDAHRRTVSTLFWVFVAQAVVLLPVTAALLGLFDVFFKMPPQYNSPAKVAFVLIALGTIARLPLVLFRGVLVGHQNTWIAELYQLAGVLIYGVAVLVFLPRAPTLVTLAWLNLIRTTVVPLAIAVHCLLRTPGTTIAPRYFDKKLLVACWKFSMALMAIQVTSLLGTHLDVFIIQAWLPVTAVALYAIAARINVQVHLFSSQVTATLGPIVAELHGAGDTDRLAKLWLNGTRFSVGFATPFIFGCGMLSRPLLLSWMGPEFADAVLPLQLLLLSAWVALVHGSSHLQLSMRGDQKYLAVAMALGQVANVGASIALVVPFGLPGVALATLLAPLIADVMVQRRVCRRLGAKLLPSYLESVGPSLLPAGIMMAAQWFILDLFAIDSLLEVAIVGALGILLFWAVFWLLSISAEEKLGLKARIKRRRARA